jgi:hypothetical protein
MSDDDDNYNDGDGGGSWNPKQASEEAQKARKGGIDLYILSRSY